MFKLTQPDSPQPFRGTVPGNLWTEIPVQDLDVFEPTMTVAVVIPFYQQPQELDRTLAGLAHQVYPRELLEVIIADDGSEPPCRTDLQVDGITVRVVRQERDGFGLARARNLGARSSNADIVIFLDSDMVPEPHFVAAHARWHHIVADAIVFGFRKHVDMDDIEPADIASALKSTSIADLLSNRPVTVPEWIEGHIERTHNVTSKRDDLYRVASGGNLSARRAFYLAVGGNDETFQEYGGEDNEFIYRALLEGGILIPDRAALAWHQGAGTWQRDDETLRRGLTQANLAQRISEQSMRHSKPGRSYLRPHVGVFVEVADEPIDQVIVVIDTILGGWFHDVHIEVRGAHARPEGLLLIREYEQDPRVSVVKPGEPSLASDASIFITVPTQAIFGRRTLDKIESALRHGGPGAMHITIPDVSPADQMIEVVQRRALRRAEHHQNSFDGLPEAMAELFGERWVSGHDLGIERYLPGIAPGTAIPPDERPQIANTVMVLNDDAIRTLAVRIHNAETNLARIRSRKVVRFTNLLGALVRRKGVRLAARQLRSANYEVRELATVEADIRAATRSS